MSDQAQWQAANDQYLADALADMRARLQRLAAQQGAEVPAANGRNVPAADAAASAPVVNTPSPPTPSGNARHASWLMWMRGEHAAHNVSQPSVPHAGTAQPAQLSIDLEAGAPDGTVSKTESSDAESSTSSSAVPYATFTPALVLLAKRLGLSDFERDLLLLCIGMELDTRMPALCAQAQHDPSKPWPTFALAFAVLDDPSWDALSPERPLRYWRLIDIHQPGPQPLIGAALSADERMVNFVKGMNYLDDRLAPLLTPLSPLVLPPSQQTVADTLLESLRHVPMDEPPPTVQLIGSDSSSKQAVAFAVASTLGTQVYGLSAELLPSASAEQESLIRLWQRESRLQPIALYVDAADLDRTDAATAQVRRFLARIGGLVFIDTREPWSNTSTHSLSADVAKPTPVEQRTIWQRLLGDSAGDHPQQLSGHFDFNLGKIEQIAHTALSTVEQHGAELGDALWDGALARTRPSMDQLAQRIEPKAGWVDIMLPDSEMSLLHQIVDQVSQRSRVYDDWGFRERMNRGLSISALFAGESGTGKTMAAEVIAKALGLSLYRIDLSAVVSKYIGETEKNLRKLFDAAEEGGVILFFDEADALFGRRSEVKDSHDRYANIEVNYLLQRLESFHGLAILATNMKSALDTAFLRRIRFVVNFPFPGVPERKAMWASIFPTKAATATLDVDRLAKLAFTGGSIQGIALNAAFTAAQAGVPITMPLVLDAARAELRKLDKPVNEADFRWLESAGGNG
jgi:hypothetical protein